MFGRDWTKGSLIRNLLSLSWPIVINQVLNVMGPTIDLIWVGKLGLGPIAGVGVAGIVVGLVMTATTGLFFGWRAMVARFVGAGDIEAANHVVWQAFILSAMFSLVVALIGIRFTEPIFILMGVEANVVAEGVAYLRIMFVGTVVMSFGMVTAGIMQASGDTVTPMKIAVVFRLLHIALCPFLVFGWWAFPRLGVSGAAMTNIISHGLGFALGLWVLTTGRSRLRLSLRNFRLDLGMMWRIVKIGIPASVMNLQSNLGHLAMMWLMVPFGTLAVAAHSITGRITTLVIQVVVGLGLAAGVLVGQNLGARQPGRAERTGWLAAGFVQAFMVICSLVILLWAESIVHIFSTEPGVVKIASTFLRILIVGYLMLGVVYVLANCLAGVGDTVPPMIISLVTIWAVQLPLAYILPQVTNLGVYGLYWAMVVAILTAVVAYTTYFRLGRWKRKPV